MKLAERQLEIEVERENRLLLAPASPHAAFVTHGCLVVEADRGRKELEIGVGIRLACRLS